MKKIYNKPCIFFEDFTLSTNVAGDCTHRPNTLNDEGCGYEDNGWVVLQTGNSGCVFQPAEIDDRICYHVPTGDIHIFVS